MSKQTEVLLDNGKIIKYRLSTLRRKAARHNCKIIKVVNRGVWLWGNRHRLRAEAKLNRPRK